MARRTKGSAAQRLGQKARDRRENLHKGVETTPTPIAGNGHGSRVEPRQEDLILVLPRPGEPDSEDLTFLKKVPGLMPMLSEGIRRYADSNVKQRTRRECIQNLNKYFVQYLSCKYRSPVNPSDLTEDGLWAGFIDFLNQPRQDGEPIQFKTRTYGLGAVKKILEELKADPNWTELAVRILEQIPKRPWPGYTRKNPPVPVLPLDQFDAVVLAADAEFTTLRERQKEKERLLAEGWKRLAAREQNFREDMALCLAALSSRYPDTLPSKAEIEADDQGLGKGVRYHGANTLAQYLYPFARDLVPLILLLAARTSLNPDLILGLCWKDLKYWETMDGRDAIRLAPYKPRSASLQDKWLDPEIDEPDGLRSLLDLIKNMTSRLRPKLPQDQRDRLFVFMPQNRSKKPKAFQHGKGPSGDITWTGALNRFIQDHNLQPFTLQQFRPTRGSEIFEATGDILASSKELGHSQAQTTWKYYTSDAVLRRFKERIGQVQLVLERWLVTDGLIDPRGDKADAGAATPGFLCLNPHDSPRPGQLKGRPCRAYGECAACPLAGVRNEVTAAAQYLGVRKAIIAGQQTMAPQTWTTKWAKILAEHDAMLETLDPKVVSRAKQIQLTYPAVG